MHNTNNVGNEEYIDLVHCGRVLWGQRRLVGAIVGMATGLMVVVSLLLPKTYTAKATLMPISTSSFGGGMAALAGQLGGGIGALIGGGGGAGGSVQQLMALLNTRTLTEKVIKDGNLLPILFPNEKSRPSYIDEGAVKALFGCMKFVDDRKGGTITISAQFKDPTVSAKLANLYVSTLQKLLNENAYTASKRNRIFIGEQLSTNKRDILELGKELSEFYKGNKISGVESYVDVPVVESKFRWRKQHGESALGKEHGLELGQELDLEKIQNKKAELESSLRSTSDATGGEALDGRPIVTDGGVVNKVPQQVYLQYLTVRRGLLTQINALLTQQYEMARIDEMKDDLAFQVIDSAWVPERRSGPKRTKMVVLVFILSTLFSSFGVILYDRNRRSATK